MPRRTTGPPAIGRAYAHSDFARRIIVELEAAGGTLQVLYPVLAQRTNMHERTLYDNLRRLEALRVIDVIRSTTDGAWGSPRAANRYNLRLSLEQWERDGPTLVADYRDRLRRLKARPMEVPTVGVQERAAAKADAAARRAEREAARPVPPPTFSEALGASIDERAEQLRAGDPVDLYGW